MSLVFLYAEISLFLTCISHHKKVRYHEKKRRRYSGHLSRKAFEARRTNFKLEHEGVY